MRLGVIPIRLATMLARLRSGIESESHISLALAFRSAEAFFLGMAPFCPPLPLLFLCFFTVAT